MITSWSFSRYKTYDQCPARAKYLYIDRMKEPGSAAMDRGSAIHKYAEDYTLGRITRIPRELKTFEPFFKSVRALARNDPNNVVAETTWAFRHDWTQTTWNDWNGCWLRVKLDLAVVTANGVEVIDHKTGKYSPQWNLQSYVEQVELYALASLFVYPDLPATPRLLFLDHGIAHPPTAAPVIYAPSDRAGLKKKWEARVRPMLRDKTFKPKPSSMCRFCSFRKDNGGPCQY
jgi:CRISPR/Cas system-associated exonuclease Cas4 (RecB family)